MKWSKRECGVRVVKVKSYKVKIDGGGGNKWVLNYWVRFLKC